MPTAKPKATRGGAGKLKPKSTVDAGEPKPKPANPKARLSATVWRAAMKEVRERVQASVKRKVGFVKKGSRAYSQAKQIFDSAMEEFRLRDAMPNLRLAVRGLLPPDVCLASQYYVEEVVSEEAEALQWP